MGLHLHDAGGQEARLLLARDPATANIPLIALGEEGARRDVDSDLPAGFVGYLPQPLQRVAFIDALERALQPRHTRGQRAPA
jgi:CheY-like chemotaxis protein